MADCQIPEEWRPVVGYEGFYVVSSLGQVKRLGRQIEIVRKGVLYTRLAPGRLMTQTVSGHGRLSVNLSRDGVRRTRLVHQLVGEAFLGPRPPGIQTRHLNGDHLYNPLSNLAYGTRLENAQDMIDHGRSLRGMRSSTAKLTDDDVRSIRASTGSNVALGESFGVAACTISQIRHGHTWRHLLAETR